MNRTFFLDIHPPFDKLFIYFHTGIIGYKGKCEFSRCADFPDPCGHEKLRYIVAFYSSLCSPLTYLIFINLNFTRYSSFLAGTLIAFESILVIEGRYVLTDGILHFFVVLSMLCISYVYRSKNLVSLVSMMIVISLTCSIKETAFSLIFIAFVTLFIAFLFENYSSKTGEVNLILLSTNLFITYSSFIAILIITYIGSFMIHIHLCNNYSQLYSNIVLLEHSHNITLLKEKWDNYQKKPLIIRVLEHIIKIHYASANLSEYGPITSRWWQWILMDHPWISYYGDDTIRLHINIFNMLLIVVSVLLSLFGLYYVYLSGFNAKNELKEKFIPILIFVLGYFSSLVPFAFVKRFTLLYHYCISVIFGLYSAASLVDALISQKRKIGILVFVFILTCSITSFFIYSTYVYGTPIDPSFRRKLLFRSIWRQSAFPLSNSRK